MIDFEDTTKLTELLDEYYKDIQYGHEHFPKITYEERQKIIEMMNESVNTLPDENGSHNLKSSSIHEAGASIRRRRQLREINPEVSFIQKAAAVLATQGVSALCDAQQLAPNTPATQAIKEVFEKKFDPRDVEFIIEHADEIKKVPYKSMLLSDMPSYDKEANFLDAFTDELKNIAKEQYGQTDDYYCLSNAAQNPQFMKDAHKLWNKMFEKVDETPDIPNWHNNAYVREMFPAQMDELRQHLSDSYSTKHMEDRIAYLENVGKMSKAIREYNNDNDTLLYGNLHFDLARAGIDNYKDAKRCLDIWCASNKRPDRYGSPYNDYRISQIAKIVKTPVKEEWMYPVMMNAVEKGGLTLSGRVPSEKTLFDACKTWKICPEMPQRLAERVGKHGLYGRMLAGAIFEQMTKQGETTQQEWKDNKNLHEQFLKELAQAEKMDRTVALKSYIPDNAVNRKRLTGAILAENGKEMTKDNFVGLYREMKQNGAFSKMLAQNVLGTAQMRVKIARMHAGVNIETAKNTETTKTAQSGNAGRHFPVKKKSLHKGIISKKINKAREI